jgi:hypothetical protein
MRFAALTVLVAAAVATGWNWAAEAASRGRAATLAALPPPLL